MKLLCVGDIHTHSKIVPRVQRLVKKFKPDKVILMGDYLDDWQATPVDNECVVAQLAELHKRLKDKLVLLYGNHDVSNILKGDYRCSGYSELNAYAAKELARLPLQKAFAYENILFTHAGLTAGWAEKYGIDLNEKSAEVIAQKLNDLSFRYYREVGAGRGGFSSTPSPIWADKEELLSDPFPHLTQVVGHTPVKTIEVSYGPKIYFTDTFSTYRDGTPYGTETFLWLTDKDAQQIATQIVTKTFDSPNLMGCVQKEESYLLFPAVDITSPYQL